MIVPFMLGFLALAASMDRHRSWFAAAPPMSMLWALRILGWWALAVGTAGCVATGGVAMGLVRATGLATPAAVVVLLIATYLCGRARLMPARRKL